MWTVSFNWSKAWPLMTSADFLDVVGWCSIATGLQIGSRTVKNAVRNDGRAGHWNCRAPVPPVTADSGDICRSQRLACTTASHDATFGGFGHRLIFWTPSRGEQLPGAHASRTDCCCCSVTIITGAHASRTDCCCCSVTIITGVMFFFIFKECQHWIESHS